MRQGPTWCNTSKDFGRIARFLHWFMGVWLIGQAAIGFYMTNVMAASPLKGTFYGLHKIGGALFLAVLLFRLVWRWTNTVPELPRLQPVIYFFSRLSAPVLYLAMFAMPVSGYIMTSAGGRTVDFWGYWSLPMLIPPHKTVAWFAHETHTYAAYILVALIVIHTLAAFYHHYVRRDRVLRRMIRQS